MEFIRPKKIGLGLDMAPLIDIVFLLLIFFMLSSSFLNPALKLDLPQAVKHDTNEPQQVVVSVDHEGKIFINTIETSMTQFKSQLESKLADSPKKSIHLRGDQDMPYRFFVEVMDLARQAGANQINIVHQENRK